MPKCQIHEHGGHNCLIFHPSAVLSIAQDTHNNPKKCLLSKFMNPQWPLDLGCWVWWWYFPPPATADPSKASLQACTVIVPSYTVKGTLATSLFLTPNYHELSSWNWPPYRPCMALPFINGYVTNCLKSEWHWTFYLLIMLWLRRLGRAQRGCSFALCGVVWDIHSTSFSCWLVWKGHGEALTHLVPCCSSMYPPRVPL